jgi:putative Holliday junction resolvase
MTKVANSSSSILALDVGERRIGLALANTVARLPQPLTTLTNDQNFPAALISLLVQYNVTTLIVGRPRNQQGDVTAQTKAVEDFVQRLQPHLKLPIVWQDESLTSVKAEAELHQGGGIPSKAAVDALAAVYILDDYLQEHGGEL